MTIEEIRDLINLASETGIAELEVQRGDTRVRIRRGLLAPAAQEIVLAEPATVPAGGRSPARPSLTGAAELPARATDGEPPLDPAVSLVKAPIVGTFYESPSPDAPPFVRVGERVQPGKVLCIIESMKLMNEIEAETSGIVESRLVINGQPVEYGEALFAIRAV
jgi:acetyl-CoA carboxylase biotin carboxyl carrier protein